MKTNLRTTLRGVLSLASAAVIAACVHAETYALCIGINDYPDAKNEKGELVDNDLKGCVNDVKAMKGAFVKNFGVKEANIRTQLDKEATLDKFIENVKWLVQNAKAGDQVIFMYSGHGGQVKEKDELQEVIVLADEQLIPGSFFGEFSKLLTVNGVNTTFFFDSCYSGGMSRDVDGKIVVRNKAMGLVKPKARSTAPTKLKAQLVSVRAKQSPTVTAGEAVFLFASQKDRTSSDISGIEGVDPHGLFTLLVLGVLEQDPKTPVKGLYDAIEAILAQINKSLKDKGSDRQFDQGPNFETSATRAEKPIVLG